MHSDFLQVAANQGLAAGALFLAAYLQALVRLGVRLRSKLLAGGGACAGGAPVPRLHIGRRVFPL